MAITYSNAQKLFICASGDTKPTVASHAGVPVPSAGDRCWVYDTNILYVTRDGTNWILFVTLG